LVSNSANELKDIDRRIMDIKYFIPIILTPIYSFLF
jgi:hypothetical protein